MKECNSEVSKEREVTYFVEDLEYLSATTLYSGEPCGGNFQPASNFNIGPGIARKMPEAENMIERVRGPGAGDRTDADHLNYEYKIPGIGQPLANIHIPLSIEKD